MKLSKKGRDRLYGSHNVFYDDDIEGDVVALYELSEVWEFEPDDFEGCVCLTVEEAKFIIKLLPMATIWAGKEAGKAIKEVVDVLDKQVEQAEGKE